MLSQSLNEQDFSFLSKMGLFGSVETVTEVYRVPLHDCFL